MGIDRLDQRNLPATLPALELLLSLDRCENVRGRFEVDQPVDVVLGRKAGDEFLLVLEDSALQVVGHTYVEDSRSACENVDEVLPVRHTLSCREASGDREILRRRRRLRMTRGSVLASQDDKGVRRLRMTRGHPGQPPLSS